MWMVDLSYMWNVDLSYTWNSDGGQGSGTPAHCVAQKSTVLSY